MDLAAQLYSHSLHNEEVFVQAAERLAAIHKRNQDLRSAITLWEEAAGHQHLLSHIELAKAYEHRLRDYPAGNLLDAYGNRAGKISKFFTL